MVERVHMMDDKNSEVHGEILNDDSVARPGDVAHFRRTCSSECDGS